MSCDCEKSYAQTYMLNSHHNASTPRGVNMQAALDRHDNRHRVGDLAVVRNIADRCVVLKEGQIVEMGETTALFDDPQHNYTRNLIRAVPVVDQTEVELRNKLGKFND